PQSTSIGEQQTKRSEQGIGAERHRHGLERHIGGESLRCKRVEYSEEDDRRDLHPADQDLAILFLSTDRPNHPVRRPAHQRRAKDGFGESFPRHLDQDGTHCSMSSSFFIPSPDSFRSSSASSQRQYLT